MRLGRNVEEIEIMDKELKKKAYQFLISEIDIETFEKFLYQLVEKIELDTKSLLFDIVNINYKSEKSKTELLSLINILYSKEELLSLKVCERCLKITQKEVNEEFYSHIDFLSQQYVENDYEYNIFYSFYRLNDEINNILEIGFSYSIINEDQINKNVKEYSELVIDKFNFYRENEDWLGFLTDISYDNFNYAKKQKETLDIYTSNKNNIGSSFYNIILKFLGLK